MLILLHNENSSQDIDHNCLYHYLVVPQNTQISLVSSISFPSPETQVLCYHSSERKVCHTHYYPIAKYTRGIVFFLMDLRCNRHPNKPRNSPSFYLFNASNKIIGRHKPITTTPITIQNMFIFFIKIVLGQVFRSISFYCFKFAKFLRLLQ